MSRGVTGPMVGAYSPGEMEQPELALILLEPEKEKIPFFITRAGVSSYVGRSSSNRMLLKVFDHINLDP